MVTKDEYIERLMDKLSFKNKLIGTISGLYYIPLAEIHELENRMKRDKKLSEVIEVQAKRAAKKKMDKMLPRLNVV